MDWKKKVRAHPALSQKNSRPFGESHPTQLYKWHVIHHICLVKVATRRKEEGRRLVEVRDEEIGCP